MEDACQCRLARAGQAGKKKCKAQLAVRRMDPLQVSQHLGKTEPLGDFLAPRQHALEICVRHRRQCLGLLLDLPHRQVTAARRHVTAFLDADQADAKLVGKPGNVLLRSIAFVETRLAICRWW